MPSPLFHLATGVASGLCYPKKHPERRLPLRLWGLVIFASIAPDLDVLVGMISGDPNSFHGRHMHSYGAAVVFGLVMGVIFGGSQRLRITLWTMGTYAVSVTLDIFSVDGRPPYGVPLLWPISDQSIISPVSLFRSFRHGGNGATPEQFFDEIFSVHNIFTLSVELALAVVLIGLIFAWRRYNRRDLPIEATDASA